MNPGKPFAVYDFKNYFTPPLRRVNMEDNVGDIFLRLEHKNWTKNLKHCASINFTWMKLGSLAKLTSLEQSKKPINGQKNNKAFFGVKFKLQSPSIKA